MARQQELNYRMVRTLAEANKGKPMKRKVDTYEYESLEECIKSDQVPANHIAEIFTDPDYYKWYAKRNFSTQKGV
tara:strand:+ start:56 stop:280 length:225 start_codon:yes stop_codon:yes gene_type:complete